MIARRGRAEGISSGVNCALSVPEIDRPPRGLLQQFALDRPDSSCRGRASPIRRPFDVDLELHWPRSGEGRQPVLGLVACARIAERALDTPPDKATPSRSRPPEPALAIGEANDK